MSIRMLSGKEWLAAWDLAGRKMDELRGEDLRKVDLPRAMALLNDAYEAAIRQHPPRPTSGLIEQQRWFVKFWG